MEKNEQFDHAHRVHVQAHQRQALQNLSLAHKSQVEREQLEDAEKLYHDEVRWRQLATKVATRWKVFVYQRRLNRRAEKYARLCGQE